MRRWAVDAVMWLLLAGGLALLGQQALLADPGRSELVGAGVWGVAQWVAYQVDRRAAQQPPREGGSSDGSGPPPSSSPA